jgi:hypothetical protein
MGALHPVLFFMFVYGISLFLALFVCRTVYYSINDDGPAEASAKKAELTPGSMTATVYR